MKHIKAFFQEYSISNIIQNDILRKTNLQNVQNYRGVIWVVAIPGILGKPSVNLATILVPVILI